MKKVALSLIALSLVAAGAFADAPKWDPKVSTELKGEAKVTLGYDLDQGVYAFANSSSAELVIDLVSGGDRATSSDKDVWGEIKVKSDGDPARIKGDGTSTAYAAGFKVVVDYAKIHFGKDAYLSITSHGTQIKYASSPDLAFLSHKFSHFDGATAVRYGKDNGVAQVGAFGDTGASNGGGIEVGYSLEKIASFTAAVGTVNAWSTATVEKGTKNADNNKLAYKAAVDVSALSDLGVSLGAGYSGTTADAKKTDAGDMAMGAKASYTLKLDGDKLYVKPSIGFGIVDNDDWNATTSKTEKTKAFNTASAGVLIGTGAKGAAFDNFGLKLDSDYGSYPGVSVGVFYSDEEAVAKTGDKKADTGINVSFNSGTLVPDLTLVAAYDMVTKGKDNTTERDYTNLTVGAAYSLKAGDLTIAPKGMVSMFSGKGQVAKAGAMKEDADSSLFAKLNVELSGLIPFTTFALNYESNDLNNGFGFSDPDYTPAKAVNDKNGKVELSCKIAF